MRIPTFRQYQQSVITMQQQNASLQKLQQQLSTGTKILTPSDDPSGAAQLVNLGSNISKIDQFTSNSTVAQATLSQQDSVLGNINDALQRIRQLAVQGMSPTNNDGARKDIALEINNSFQQLLSLANTRDANGEYLYSGGAGDTPPFLDNGTTVSYQGDQTARSLQIGDGAKVTARDPGDQIFMNIPGGDGTIEVQAGSNNAGSLVVGQFSGDHNFTPDTYTITFTGGSNGQPLNYTVTDSATPTPNTVASGVYQDGNSLTFNGVKMTLSGTPANGDTVVVTPAQPQSLFDTVRNLVSALNMPAGANSNTSNIQNLMAQGLGNLDQALDAINTQRASVGARLNTIDSTNSINADFKLQLNTLQSSTQSLDYADAISRFNQQLTSLQAAQQSFAKMANLSLFQYL